MQKLSPTFCRIRPLDLQRSQISENPLKIMRSVPRIPPVRRVLVHPELVLLVFSGGQRVALAEDGQWDREAAALEGNVLQGCLGTFFVDAEGEAQELVVGGALVAKVTGWKERGVRYWGFVFCYFIDKNK